MITAEQIKSIAGSGARRDLIAAIVNGWPTAVHKAKITTARRAAHFLAQIMTETGGLKILEESGAYQAPRIMKIFGVGNHSAGITEPEARRIAALPIAQRGPVLFNRVYGRGNPTKMREFDNTGPNDGWLYRGGGMMQATGKSNYAKMAKKTGLPLVEHPELLHQPDSAFTAAYLEWAQDGRCNAAADRDDVVSVRKIINGGKNGLAECRKYLVKAKAVLADYDVEAPPPAAVATAVDESVRGDPELYYVQKRLKARNYSPGILDGEWGSGTSGALGGFINDRGGHIPVPASLDAFNAVREDIKAELQRAESERWVRPVSAARKSGDSAVVATLAPEVVPAKESRTITVWGAVVTFFAGVYQTFSEAISSGWEFLFDHKDSIPTDPGMLQNAWGWITGLPSEIWIFAGTAGFIYIAVKTHMAVKKITNDVTTGARQ